MIIIRQKLFAFGGFDWWFDEDGNQKPDLSEEDKRKLEALKKKYPDEWRDFENKRRGRSTSGSSGYSSYDYNGRRSSSSSSGSSSSGSSSGSSRSSSSSSSSSSFTDDDWWEDRRRKREEEWERMRRESEERSAEREREFEEQRKGIDHDMRQTSDGLNLASGATLLLGGKIIAKHGMRELRKSEVNSKIGHDRRMKDSDRERIDEIKSKSNKDKELLRTIAEGKSKEKVDKAEKKYRTRRALVGALDRSITGASIGGDIGFLYDAAKTASTSKVGTSKSVKRTAKGLALGGLGGAAAGILYNTYKANKDINKIKNSKNKEKEVDRIKVGSGKMTESEFVKKHGGRKKD